MLCLHLLFDSKESHWQGHFGKLWGHHHHVNTLDLCRSKVDKCLCAFRNWLVPQVPQPTKILKGRWYMSCSIWKTLPSKVMISCYVWFWCTCLPSHCFTSAASVHWGKDSCDPSSLSCRLEKGGWSQLVRPVGVSYFWTCSPLGEQSGHHLATKEAMWWKRMWCLSELTWLYFSKSLWCVLEAKCIPFKMAGKKRNI